MADLGQLLGTILGSLAHARRLADEETAAIAEYYRSNPLLEGMSLPRIRVPELTIDLPMLIEAHQEGEPNILQEDAVIRAAIVDELKKAAQREGFRLSQTVQKQFDEEVKIELAKVRSDGGERGYPREMIVRAVDSAFARTMSEEKHERLLPAQLRRIGADLRQRAGDIALKKVGIPPKISASIVTAEVKEGAAAGNVTRLRIVLKEEGMEWSVGENQDGTVSRKLTPE
ncbi:hypothetical protein GURASL_08220 [Geotalea uraniireducens]|uniref:Uncharacterized protein n=1 Tax=Geotalea uraniireducens TaxID=351604 RepID=A0ABN6VNR3_9BACT|nr:hypothetical protein [Geotalea uraniireducens]BDV41899.1 hypothetical protein GURASL_08220 [Geotalea uraniireducens]